MKLWTFFFMILGIIACGKQATTEKSRAISPTIQINAATTQIGIGGTLALSATGQLTDDTSQDLTSQLIWSTSDSSLATVSSSGVVTGIGVGSVTITGAASSLLGSSSAVLLSGSIALTVNNSPLQFSSLTSSVCSICLGRTAISSGGKRLFNWTISNSSNNSIASSLQLFGLFSGLSINNTSTCSQNLFTMNVSSSCKFVFNYVAPTVSSSVSSTNTLTYTSTTSPWMTTNTNIPLTIYPAAYSYTTSNGLSSNTIYGNVVVTTSARSSITAGGPSLPIGSLLVPAAGGGVDYSVDGGATWLNINTSNGLIANSTNSIAMGSDGTIYVASDSGLSILANNSTTWTTNSGVGAVVWLYQPPSSPSTLYAAGVSNFMISSNKGTSFNNLLAQNSRYVHGNSTGTKVFVGTLSGTYYSINSGTTNNTLGIGSNGRPFYDESQDILYVTQGNILYRSNVGAYSTLSTVKNFGVAITNLYVWNNGQNILVPAINTGLYYSTDGGTNFTLYTPSNAGLLTNSVTSVTIDSNGTWWLSSASGGIFAWDH